MFDNDSLFGHLTRKQKKNLFRWFKCFIKLLRKNKENNLSPNDVQENSIEKMKEK